MDVDALSLATAGIAFAAGLVSFLSPCVLPLVPVYLSYVSGVAVEDLDRHRWQVLRIALAFTGGFTVLFVVLGVAAGSLGGVLASQRTLLSIIAGVVLIIAGLFVMDVIHLPGGRGARIPAIGGPLGAFVAGGAVALGWTPCVGPVLGAILTMAGSGQSPMQGGLLLFIYSVGLAVPFLAAAVAFGWVSGRLSWIKRHYRTIRIVAGILLIIAGLMMVTGTFEWLARSIPSWSPLSL